MQVYCLSLSGADSIQCSWSGFVERESDVDYYKFGVGKAEGDDSVYRFKRVEAGASSHRATGRFIKTHVLPIIICIQGFKKIQNWVARSIDGAIKYSHATPLLMKLHTL